MAGVWKETRGPPESTGPGPAPAILLWPWASDAAVLTALLGLLAGTASESMVVLPAGERARGLEEGLEPRARGRVTILNSAAKAGFAATLNEALRASVRTDLVVVADACVLPEGWLARLRLAAYADDTVAGASPLLSGEGDAQFAGLDAMPAREAVSAGEAVGVSDALRAREAEAPRAPLHPRISTLWPQCAYLRRAAMELVGPADDCFSHPAAVLADLAAKALRRGLSCTLADDLCVERPAGGLAPCPESELRALAARHPWIDALREDTGVLELGPLRRALMRARIARTRLSVTVDARALGPASGGTQAYTASLVRALARSERLTVRAVLAGDTPPEVIETLAEDRDLEIVTYEQVIAGLPRTDVVHRPQQVFTTHDLSLLRLLGERLVISHLDLIAYRNPVYHASVHQWRGYRRTTRMALGAADRVLFLSEHARRDAVAEELIDTGRTALTGVGIDARWTSRTGAGIDLASPSETLRRPQGVPPGRELLVMIGADYLHKNRPFALALADELRQRHGWEGLLVMAGAHVSHGSSAQDEAELLRTRPYVAAHVIDLGPVSDAEKRWLLAHAQALLCPSTYEGYGLTPLEAATAGLPCIYASTTSLGEVVGRQAATIVPWDPAASADAAAGLLYEGEQRERHLSLLRAALHRCDWEPIVDRLIGVYHDAVGSPFRASSPRAWEELQREQYIVELDDAYRELRERVAYALPLIDRDGLLTVAQQRGLMRIAARPWLKGPLLGPVGLLGEMGERD